MRFTRSKEARNPNPHTRGDDRIFRTISSSQKGIEKTSKIFGQLFGDDVLIQFLPNTLGIALISFNHTIDWSVDRFGKQLFDFHMFYLFAICVMTLTGMRGNSGLRKVC